MFAGKFFVTGHRVDIDYQHLLGRQYIPGRVHCYALVRAFFADILDIQLSDYVIPHDWDADRLNLIEKIYPREGFAKVEDWNPATLRPADVLCVAVGSANPNHFVINPGDGNLLHHPLNQLSRVEPMRDFWRKQTCYVLRHPDVPDLRPAQPNVEIMELNRARYSL